jgi:ADP-dependent NAD(P)H-hydrate dehydratase
MPQAQLENLTEQPLPMLPPRRADSHKGDYGRALLVGGSRGMSGAIAMAGLATLRSGAGLVTLAVPQTIQDVVASFSPCYMTHGLTDADGQFTKPAAGDVIDFAFKTTALALGPGLGRSATVIDFVEVIHGVIKQPLVVDADALYALAQRPAALSNAGGPRVLTPHPGEFERLTGQLYKTSSRIEAASQLARGEDDLHYQFRNRDGKNVPFVVILKGHETVVTDGQRYSINHTGNPGMATGGSGDVLTGIITALLCQGLSPFDAARLGVHVHGLAGDLAALELGQVSLIATDLIDYLPHAFVAVAS